ncbi:unnamed protein product [Caenorhabditis auriculariae]|uniref:Secreted protein n=1 Tax=Caenorhabditis auriculariae TaxID=2777116 RepID=A0A8S1GTU3_9PELO|nr:unnamed protein product [Caenorhabditis auriculariae]
MIGTFQGRPKRCDMWLAVVQLLVNVIFALPFTEDLPPHKSHCYSCASFAYLPLWQKLMHHYYPPKNFTDSCWQPDGRIGLVPCTSACFTLVEDIDQQDC